MNCRKNHNYTENVRANRIYYRTVMKYAYYYSRYQHSHVLQRVAQNVNHRRANVDFFFVADDDENIDCDYWKCCLKDFRCGCCHLRCY